MSRVNCPYCGGPPLTAGWDHLPSCPTVQGAGTYVIDGGVYAKDDVRGVDHWYEIKPMLDEMLQVLKSIDKHLHSMNSTMSLIDSKLRGTW